MGTWTDEIRDAFIAEFSDLPSLTEATQIVIRLVLAALLGGLLGFERSQKGKAAGVRTHMLVALGSALFVLVPMQIGAQGDAMSRVVQGIVAGVGFLGAGTILKHGENLAEVKGLTTAAGIWLTAAIGIAVGMGREVTAILSTLLALTILFLVPRCVEHLDRHEP
ncbi:MgtC/SapB family protein [Pseudomonas sp. RIT-PI-AD]|uniref:MgtC/SapB family protein n=1 Tax=Pseudomonas sp. RIT-PI-AD TaxID=3035294 RepID=UPI0021DADD96|nr:MgtC/SapB family protein [Pseudomonas sp. RIT-PI-AD]